MSPHASQSFLINTRVVAALVSVLFLMSIVEGQEHVPSEISTYITQLKSSNRLVCKRAADALYNLGPAAKPALPYLVALLSHRDDVVRLAAVNAIANMGPEAREARHELLRLFNDPSRNVRLRAADAFAWIGQNSPEDLSTVVKLLQDKKATIRECAAVSIIRFNLDAKEAIPQLLSLLDTDSSEDVRRAAAYTLGIIGQRDVATIAALTKALADKEPTVKIQSIQSIANIGPNYAKGAIPEIIRLLESENPQLRGAATDALAAFGSEARGAVPGLIRLLKDPDMSVRKSAIYTIGAIGPEAKNAIPALVDFLDSNDPDFRGRSAQSIGYIGPEARDAVPRLIMLCSDSNPTVRITAIGALGEIGQNAQTAVSTLLKLLDADDAEIRGNAAYSLGGIGSASKDAIPKLISLLGSKEEMDLCSAAYALGQIGPSASAAVLPLSELLGAPQDCVRKNAARALAGLGPQAKLAIPNLILVLKDSDAEVRKSSAQALGKLGVESRGALPFLIAGINDPDYYVRESVAESLVNISSSLAAAKNTGSLSELREAYKALKDSPYPEVQSRAEAVRSAIDSLKGVNSQQVILWAQDHSYLAIGLGLILWFLVALLVSSVLLWLRPIWLFRINESIPDSLNLKILERLTDFKFPLKFILVVGFFHYHRKVLDAWISRHIETAREEFERLDTVRSRSVHVDAPVIFEGRSLPTLSVKILSPLFNRNRICLLITGEGGSGKTSLACQIARWAMGDPKGECLASHFMIPILLDQDVPHHSLRAGVPAFIEVVRGGLQRLLGQPNAPSAKLTEHLLRSGRILVIADHLSEMNDATRQLINPAWVDFPAAALIVTSRIKEPLDGVPKASINPLRIEGNRLSSFMESYLIQKGKRHLFDDSEFFHACGRLSILAGARDITVLLATFYADQLAAAKESSNGSQPPDNIPDVMLGYVIEANRNVGQDGLATKTVITAAKQLAWECLKHTYQPTSISFADVCTVLGGEEYARNIIGYLEHELSILQKSRSIEGYVRFVLDPLAEYLAALYLIELYGDDEDQWREFMAQSETQTSETQRAREFLLAVRECCLTKGALHGTPLWLPNQLAQMGLLPVDVNSA